MKFTKYFIFLFMGLLISRNLFAVEADCQNISQDQYFQTTLSEITTAKESISLVMYMVSFDPVIPGTHNRIIEAAVN